MNTNTKLCAGAGLLFLSAYSLLAGHDLLARTLAAHPLLDGWEVMSVRLATFVSLLIAHGCAGVFILPMVRLSRGLGMTATAAQICFGTALLALTGRVAAELVTGLSAASYPVLSAAVVTTVMSVVLAPRLRLRAWGVRGRVGGGSGSQWLGNPAASASRSVRESA